MLQSREWTFDGTRTEIAARSWTDPAVPPRYVALVVHGYGEHTGRYGHVASALVTHGATVYGLDHIGHGGSGGERVLIEDFEDVVADLHTLAETARGDRPDLPVVLIGHSMGGMIAARYAQLHGETLAAVVLSGPILGELETAVLLLSLDEIPDIPLDPTALSRDPAVGEAYAADPLVWHGPFKRPTVEAIVRALATINDAGSLGTLPMLWVHGGEDQIIPVDGTRKGIEILRGVTHSSHVYEGARHEVFNETNQDEVLADVTTFIDAVLDG